MPQTKMTRTHDPFASENDSLSYSSVSNNNSIKESTSEIASQNDNPISIELDDDMIRLI